MAHSPLRYALEQSGLSNAGFLAMNPKTTRAKSDMYKLSKALISELTDGARIYAIKNQKEGNVECIFLSLDGLNMLRTSYVQHLVRERAFTELWRMKIRIQYKMEGLFWTSEDVKHQKRNGKPVIPGVTLITHRDEPLFALMSVEKFNRSSFTRKI